MAKYLLELKATSYAMVRFPPSETAAAAIHIARRICSAGAEWTAALVHYSGYTAAALEPCVAALEATLAASISSPQQGVRRKYAAAKMGGVSELPELTAFIGQL